MPKQPAIAQDEFRLSKMLSGKFAEIIAIGHPVTPARAIEIIRRTDVFWWGGRWARFSVFDPLQNFARALDRAVGFPGAWRYAPDKQPERSDYSKLVKFWCNRWGAIDTRYVFNQQIERGTGFCHPSGAIVYAVEVGRYPSGLDLYNDLRLIAEAFPDLSMDVAVWCQWRGSMLGLAGQHLIDAASLAELRTQVAEPTVGFLLRDGRVTTVRGFDQRLFGHFGLRYPEAIERAVLELRQLQAVPHDEGDTGLRVQQWLNDAVLQDWTAKARAAGLVR